MEEQESVSPDPYVTIAKRFSEERSHQEKNLFCTYHGLSNKDLETTDITDKFNEWHQISKNYNFSNDNEGLEEALRKRRH